MVSVNGLTIDDGTTYLLEEVTYRGMPDRDNQASKISYRSGFKRLRSEWGGKTISLKGRVFAANPTALQAAIDTLQQNFAVEDATIILDVGRSYVGTLKTNNVPTQHYSNSMVEYTADFQCFDPFAYTNPVTVSGTVVSGTVTYSGTITISGNVYAEPTIYVYPTGAPAGNAGISSLQVGYTSVMESITVSGVVNYTAAVVLDYHAFNATSSGIVTDYSGIFSRWEPGARAFTITTSGTHQGYNWLITYAPRYYE